MVTLLIFTGYLSESFINSNMGRSASLSIRKGQSAKISGSFKKYLLKNRHTEYRLNDCYDLEDMIFFSVEFDKIIKTENFKSKKLFNLHFSLLPKYRGCHTNFFQLYNGENKPDDIPIKEQGSIIVYRSNEWHRITPLIKVTRYSLVYWAVCPRLI